MRLAAFAMSVSRQRHEPVTNVAWFHFQWTRYTYAVNAGVLQVYQRVLWRYGIEDSTPGNSWLSGAFRDSKVNSHARRGENHVEPPRDDLHSIPTSTKRAKHIAYSPCFYKLPVLKVNPLSPEITGRPRSRLRVLGAPDDPKRPM